MSIRLDVIRSNLLAVVLAGIVLTAMVDGAALTVGIDHPNYEAEAA